MAPHAEPVVEAPGFRILVRFREQSIAQICTLDAVRLPSLNTVTLLAANKLRADPAFEYELVQSAGLAVIENVSAIREGDLIFLQKRTEGTKPQEQHYFHDSDNEEQEQEQDRQNHSVRNNNGNRVNKKHKKGIKIKAEPGISEDCSGSSCDDDSRSDHNNEEISPKVKQESIQDGSTGNTTTISGAAAETPSPVAEILPPGAAVPASVRDMEDKERSQKDSLNQNIPEEDLAKKSAAVSPTGTAAQIDYNREDEHNDGDFEDTELIGDNGDVDAALNKKSQEQPLAYNPSQFQKRTLENQQLPIGPTAATAADAAPAAPDTATATLSTPPQVVDDHEKAEADPSETDNTATHQNTNASNPTKTRTMAIRPRRAPIRFRESLPLDKEPLRGEDEASAAVARGDKSKKSGATTKRGPGRPPKDPTTKQGPGRPPKDPATKRGPGRLPKDTTIKRGPRRPPEDPTANAWNKRGPGRPPNDSATKDGSGGRGKDRAIKRSPGIPRKQPLNSKPAAENMDSFMATESNDSESKMKGPGRPRMQRLGHAWATNIALAKAAQLEDAQPKKRGPGRPRKRTAGEDIPATNGTARSPKKRRYRRNQNNTTMDHHENGDAEAGSVVSADDQPKEKACACVPEESFVLPQDGSFNGVSIAAVAMAVVGLRKRYTANVDSRTPELETNAATNPHTTKCGTHQDEMSVDAQNRTTERGSIAAAPTAASSGATESPENEVRCSPRSLPTQHPVNTGTGTTMKKIVQSRHRKHSVIVENATVPSKVGVGGAPTFPFDDVAATDAIGESKNGTAAALKTSPKSTLQAIPPERQIDERSIHRKASSLGQQSALGGNGSFIDCLSGHRHSSKPTQPLLGIAASMSQVDVVHADMSENNTGTKSCNPIYHVPERDGSSTITRACANVGRKDCSEKKGQLCDERNGQSRRNGQSNGSDNSVKSHRSTITLAEDAVKRAAEIVMAWPDFDAEKDDDDSSSEEESDDSSDDSSERIMIAKKNLALSETIKPSANPLTHCNLHLKRESKNETSTECSFGNSTTCTTSTAETSRVGQKQRRSRRKIARSDPHVVAIASARTACKPKQRGRGTKGKRANPAYQVGERYFLCLQDGHIYAVEIIGLRGPLHRVVRFENSRVTRDVPIAHLMISTPELEEEQETDTPEGDTLQSVCSYASSNGRSNVHSTEGREIALYSPRVSTDGVEELAGELDEPAGHWIAQQHRIVYFCDADETPSQVASKFPRISLNKLLYDNRPLWTGALRGSTQLRRGAPLVLPKMWLGRPVVSCRNQNNKSMIQSKASVGEENFGERKTV